MFNLCIIVFCVTIAIPIISAAEKDQITESNKNINLYLVPPTGLKEFLPEYKQTVYREPGIQHPHSESSGYIVRSERAEDEKIAIKVIQEDQKSYVVQPSYNDELGNRQSHPNLKFTNPEDPNTKYALEPEGPKQTKVTVKVIKEHKKTYAVDPSYIENASVAPEYNKPEVIYKSINPEFINSESVYSNPEYTKYDVDAKEKNVFVKVLEDEKKTYVEDRKYHSDNSFNKPEYRKIEYVYTDSEPRYKVPESEYNTYRINDEQSREKDIILKEDKNAFNIEPKYKRNIFKPENNNRQIITEYRKSEPNYVKYQVNKEEPNVLVKVVKENKKSFVATDPQYKNENSYLVPAYRKSTTEYEETALEHRQSESDHHKYEDHENENRDKTVFVKEDKKTFLVEPKYKSDKSEPEYRRSESDYHKYGENEREIKVYDKEDKKKYIDSKHKNDDAHFEPEYRKSVTDYEKSERDYRMSDDSGYHKYEGKDEEPKEKDVYVYKDKKAFVDSKYKNYDRDSEPANRESDDSGYNKYEVKDNDPKENEDKNTYVVDNSKYKNDNTYFEPQNRKSMSEYEKSEPDYKKSESNYDKYDTKNEKHQEKDIYVADSKRENDNVYDGSEYRKSEPEYKLSKSDHDNDDDHEEEHREEKELAKNPKDIFHADLKYKHADTHSDSDYKKYEKEYKKSEPKLSGDESKHDVLIKIWSNKS